MVKTAVFLGLCCFLFSSLTGTHGQRRFVGRRPFRFGPPPQFGGGFRRFGRPPGFPPFRFGPRFNGPPMNPGFMGGFGPPPNSGGLFPAPNGMGGFNPLQRTGGMFQPGNAIFNPNQFGGQFNPPFSPANVLNPDNTMFPGNAGVTSTIIDGANPGIVNFGGATNTIGNIPGGNTMVGATNVQFPGTVMNTIAGTSNMQFPGMIPNTIAGTANFQFPGTVPNTMAGTTNMQMPGTVPNTAFPGVFPNNIFPNTIQNNVFPGTIQNTAFPGAIPNTAFTATVQNSAFPGALPNTAFTATVQNNAFPGSLQMGTNTIAGTGMNFPTGTLNQFTGGSVPALAQVNSLGTQVTSNVVANGNQDNMIMEVGNSFANRFTVTGTQGPGSGFIGTDDTGVANFQDPTSGVQVPGSTLATSSVDPTAPGVDATVTGSQDIGFLPDVSVIGAVDAVQPSMGANINPTVATEGRCQAA